MEIEIMVGRLAFACVVLFIVIMSTSSTLCTAGCVAERCHEYKWGYAENGFDSYDVATTQLTPKGTPFDPSGMKISGQLIDRLTDEVETCLGQTIERSAFVVKVANDWTLNCDKTEQVLPILAGSAGCLAKGLTPTSECQCRWRAGIKCPNSIIVTPNFFLYKDALIRYVTGEPNPWAIDKLANCAAPTTTPLSDGSDPKNGLVP